MTLLRTQSFTEFPSRICKLTDKLLLVGFKESLLKIIDIERNQVLKEIQVTGWVLSFKKI